MSNYIELAKKANQEENIESRIEKVAPILKARLEAMIKSQEAEIMDLRSRLTEADQTIDKARGVITTDVEYWMNSIDSKKTERDVVAAELQEAEAYLDELNDELKLFS